MTITLFWNWWYLPGFLVGLALYAPIFPNDARDRDTVGFAILGVALGIVIGHYLV